MTYFRSIRRYISYVVANNVVSNLTIRIFVILIIAVMLLLTMAESKNNGGRNLPVRVIQDSDVFCVRV